MSSAGATRAAGARRVDRPAPARLLAPRQAPASRSRIPGTSSPPAAPACPSAARTPRLRAAAESPRHYPAMVGRDVHMVCSTRHVSRPPTRRARMSHDHPPPTTGSAPGCRRPADRAAHRRASEREHPIENDERRLSVGSEPQRTNMPGGIRSNARTRGLRLPAQFLRRQRRPTFVTMLMSCVDKPSARKRGGPQYRLVDETNTAVAAEAGARVKRSAPCRRNRGKPPQPSARHKRTTRPRVLLKHEPAALDLNPEPLNH